MEENYKEFVKCRESPLYFLAKYAYIQDSNNQRKVKWEAWPYLVDIIELLHGGEATAREIIVAKANQLGITWAIVSYGGVWLPIFHDNVSSLMISHKEQGGSWELIRKCKYVMDNLPDFLKRDYSRDSRSEIEFAKNHSRVLALPSTPRAGAGFNASFVFRDELDLHPYAEENFAFISPTIDAGAAQIVDVSTRNTDIARETSHFVKRYLQAKTGDIAAKAIFLGWRLRPTRADGMTLDQWFEERVQKRYPPWEVDAHYPETEEQFLAEARTTRFFDQEGVAFIRRSCEPPIDTDPEFPSVRIWARPEPGATYCSFLDPSGGSDPHAAGWMDLATKRLVCVSHGKEPVERVSMIFDKYNRYYNNAYNEFELNGDVGRMTGQFLDKLQTPNRRMKNKKHGWWTGGNQSNSIRQLMLSGLEEVVRNKRMRIHYNEISNELDFWVKREGEDPTIPRGKHDDLTMMLGGLWQISKERTPSGYSSSPPKRWKF